MVISILTLCCDTSHLALVDEMKNKNEPGKKKRVTLVHALQPFKSCFPADAI